MGGAPREASWAGAGPSGGRRVHRNSPLRYVEAMRLIVLGVMAISGLAFAQNGSWGGYVSGWTPSNGQSTGVWTGYVNGWVGNTRVQSPGFQDRTSIDPRTRQQVQQNIAAQQYLATQFYFAQQQQAQRAKEEREEAARAEAAEQARLQAQVEYEQQRAEEARAELERQQWAQQQERLQHERELLQQERERAEAARDALAKEEQQRAAQREAEQKLEAEREQLRQALARAEDDAKPREKGPEIYRWVDENGVTHLSTKPRSESR